MVSEARRHRTYSDRYTCNNRYSKKALMWLLRMEETDGVQIMHCHNGQE